VSQLVTESRLANAHLRALPRLPLCLLVPLMLTRTVSRSPVLTEELLQTYQPFPKPVLLSELVDTLVDIWEDEDN
jgi:hypothetical protein